MKAIYSSKLYKASTRKSVISAALTDPVNSELVMQLAEALDEEYQTPQNLIKDYDEKVKKASESKERIDDNLESDDIDEEVDARSPEAEDITTHDSEPVHNIKDDKHDRPEHEPSSEMRRAEPSVKESTDTSKKQEPVEGTSDTDEDVHDAKQDADQIKSMLNLDEETDGVTRVATKQSELWIYYSDSTNLNNKMWQIIDKLNSSSYSWLEFNRLARSENAMVFQILKGDSEQDVDENE